MDNLREFARQSRLNVSPPQNTFQLWIPANPLSRGARFQRWASVWVCSAGVCKSKALPVRSRVVFPREGRTLVCQLSAHGLLTACVVTTRKTMPARAHPSLTLNNYHSQFHIWEICFNFASESNALAEISHSCIKHKLRKVRRLKMFIFMLVLYTTHTKANANNQTGLIFKPLASNRLFSD